VVIVGYKLKYVKVSTTHIINFGQLSDLWAVLKLRRPRGFRRVCQVSLIETPIRRKKKVPPLRIIYYLVERFRKFYGV
jgi:hypothetical protein